VSTSNEVTSDVLVICKATIDRAPWQGESVNRALVESAQRGDEEAFAALMYASGDRLMAVAYRILQDGAQAEDAVQDAIVTAWRELPDLRDPDRFQGWLYRVLVHACYTQAKRTRRWNAGLRMLTSEPSYQSDELTSVDDRDELDRAFRRLPPEQRAIVVLHHYLGWHQAEVAAMLDVPLGTVKSRLHYATAALRAAMEADARTTSIVPREERLA
jgi:RNA polymerase sigma-70 factor, ECF subfamily